MAKRSLYETALTINDTHCPFHDPFAIRGVLKFAKDLNPDVLFILGDMIDCADISKFNRNPLRVLSIGEQRDIIRKNKAGNEKDIILQAAMQREFNELFQILTDLRKALPNTRIIYIYGNHEYRLYRFLTERAPQLYGLTRAGSDQVGMPVMSIEYLLRFDELGIEKCFSEKIESHFLWGDDLILGHFDIIRKHSGATARALIEEKGISVIQSHTHRLGSFFKTLYGEVEEVGYENGCLCMLNPEYKENPNWQQGFSVVHKKRGGSRFHVQQIPIVDHKFFYGGTEYDGTKGLKRKPVYGK